jgi:hypothetical protein
MTMGRFHSPGAMLLFALSVALPSAQSKPDFSGQWSLDWTSIPLPAGAKGPGTGPGTGAPRGGAFGESFSAVQDARTLVVTYQDPEGPVRHEFALDGRETRSLVSTRRGQVEQQSTARWKGEALTLVSKTPTNVLTRTLTLKGNVLAMSLSLTIQDGPPVISSIRYTRGAGR